MLNQDFFKTNQSRYDQKISLVGIDPNTWARGVFFGARYRERLMIFQFFDLHVYMAKFCLLSIGIIGFLAKLIFRIQNLHNWYTNTQNIILRISSISPWVLQRCMATNLCRTYRQNWECFEEIHTVCPKGISYRGQWI